MKTLVIHPSDKTTDVLKIIYENHISDWTIINDYNISNKKIKSLIYNHDRIIMIGHGSPSGLFNPHNYCKYIIDERHISLLKYKKDCVYIWCNADQFIKQHNLKNCFYTGMIISEVGEAMFCKVNSNLKEVTESTILFAESIRNNIDLSPNLMCENSVKQYNTSNNSDVINFNRKRIYYF